MKIAFLHDEYTTQYGVMSLSATLKQNGFSTDVFVSQIEKSDLVSKVVEYEPDILAISAMTPGYGDLAKFARLIKDRLPQLFVVVGGPHPTFFPEAMHKDRHIDAICRGEGEDALLELVSSLKNNRLNTHIKNLWVRSGSTIVENATRPFIEDLDTLPYPDREVYFKRYPDLAKREIKFMIGRGCPFDCTYCFNAKMREFQSGKWVRFSSVERVISEIRDVQKRHPIEWVSFLDDTFNTNAEYLQSLLDRYKKEIDIPFLCRLRIDLASEKQIGQLKKAGVERITVGIEHGNEEFRRKYLNRAMSNTKIVEFGRWLRERKIRLITNNMVGFPNEDLALAFDTIDINIKLKPDLASICLLNPYPATRIYEYCKQESLLPKDFSFDMLTGHSSFADNRRRIKSVIKNRYMSRLVNLRCFIMVLIYCPWLRPAVELLVKLPPNPVYEFIGSLLGEFRVSWRYARTGKERAVLLKRILKF